MASDKRDSIPESTEADSVLNKQSSYHGEGHDKGLWTTQRHTQHVVVWEGFLEEVVATLRNLQVEGNW